MKANWSKTRRDQLEVGELDEIIEKLEAFIKTSKEARQYPAALLNQDANTLLKPE